MLAIISVAYFFTPVVGIKHPNLFFGHIWIDAYESAN